MINSSLQVYFKYNEYVIEKKEWNEYREFDNHKSHEGDQEVECDQHLLLLLLMFLYLLIHHLHVYNFKKVIKLVLFLIWELISYK